MRYLTYTPPDPQPFSAQPKDKPELPPAPPDLDGDKEESAHQSKEPQLDVVSDESGRSLAVTLHEVCGVLIVGYLYVQSNKHVKL